MPGQIIKCHGVCAIKPMSKVHIDALIAHNRVEHDVVPQEEQELDNVIEHDDKKRHLEELETKQQHLAEVMAAYEFGLQKMNELAEIEKVKERELELIHEEVKKKRMLIDIPRLELGQITMGENEAELEPKRENNRVEEQQQQVRKLPKTKLNGKNNSIKKEKPLNGTGAPSRWR